MTDARPANSTTTLSTGDVLAEAGDWPAAIEAWRRAAGESPALRPAVERRLEWFLTETGEPTGQGSRIRPLVLTFLIATALGTAFLAFAGEPGSLGADLWAVAAWAMIAAASVAALLAARRSGEAPLGRLFARARRAAERLDRDPTPGEAP